MYVDTKLTGYELCKNEKIGEELSGPLFQYIMSNFKQVRPSLFGRSPQSGLPIPIAFLLFEQSIPLGSPLLGQLSIGQFMDWAVHGLGSPWIDQLKIDQLKIGQSSFDQLKIGQSIPNQ